MATLQDFMVSRVREKMMELFFSRPEEMYYVREITRETKEEINAVRRELDRMVQAGILKYEQRSNRLYYFLNKRYLYFTEIQQMVVKNTGLGKKILKNKAKLGNVLFVMFSGKFVRSLRPRQDEVDILVIGDIVLPELQVLMKEEEARLGRELNYAVFSAEEFTFRKTRRDPFIMEILFGVRVMVVGSEDEFVERQVPGV
jgi:hypothetical protein